MATDRTIRYRERQRRYYKSKHGIATRKAYRQTKKFKAAQKRYRARRNQLAATNRQVIKRKVFEHYCEGEPRCMMPGCRVTCLHVLQLDHIDNGGNTHRRATQNHIYQWVIRHHFPLGFQVLCANCNRAKYHGVNWL